ncbi:hypothetical protein EMGBS15_00090 [Filimonas sp.]|nr:hypothetical protein EMGBS15_00090 [Filimonas sp.]
MRNENTFVKDENKVQRYSVKINGKICLKFTLHPTTSF